jgi:hypothetical protein
MSIARTITDWLDRNGESQAGLARRLEPEAGPGFVNTVNAWARGHREPDAPNILRLALRELERPAVPDVERAACTILARRISARRELADWVARIVAEPSFTEYLDGALADDIREHRHEITTAESLVRRGLAGSAAEALAEYPERIGTEYPHPLDRSLDEAVWRLGSAVVEFRRDGRREGDRTSDIGGFTVTTSLAAAVAEYADRVAEAYASECDRLEDDR